MEHYYDLISLNNKMWGQVDQGHYFTLYHSGKWFKWDATSHNIYLRFWNKLNELEMTT